MARSRDNGRIDPNDFNGWVGDGNADATAALTWAINLLNSSEHDVLDLGGHSYLVTSELPPLVGLNKRIQGVGADIILNGPTTAFQFGTGGTFCHRTMISDVHIQNNGTAAAQGWAFEFAAAIECSVVDSTFQNISGLLRFGKDQQVARCTARDITGTCNQGGATDGLVRIEAGVTTRLENVHISTGQTPSTGAQYKIITRAGTTVDSVWISDCHTQIFAVGVPNADPNAVPDGKQYGLELDNSTGNIYNIWINNGTVFDHTTEAGIYIHNSAGGTGQYECIHIDDLRNDADEGVNVRIDNQSGKILESVHIMNSFFYVTGDNQSSMEILNDGNNMRGTYISGNTIFATDGSLRKAAIEMRGDDFIVTDNQISRTRVYNPAGFSAGVEIADPNSTKFVVSNNVTRILGAPVVDGSAGGAAKTISGNI